jgi:signal transduction histidine kinase
VIAETDESDSRELMARQMLLYARDLKAVANLERLQKSELAAATERLQRLDRLKTDFLSFVSHELRTPLAPMALVKLLEAESLSPHAQEIVQLVQQGYERLDLFVSQAVGFFQAMVSAEEWTDETTDICKVVEGALTRLPGGVYVDTDLPEGPCGVRGAEKPLGQILDILVDNVVKHAQGAPRAAIKVRCAGRVSISVQDFGRGFPPELATEITRAFTPGDIMHHNKGSALSVALAVQLAERCGGRLTAHSDGFGTGATFVLELDGSDAVS